MANIIKIKRSNINESPAVALAEGELAFSTVSKNLFIGDDAGNNLIIGGASSSTTYVEQIQDVVGGMSNGSESGITVNYDNINGNLNYYLNDTTVTAGSYGSASKVPVFTVNAQGQITSASTSDVAGVTDFDYNTSTGVLDIDTADGANFSTTVTLAPFTTSTLVEGNNKYYLDSRARGSISVFDAGGDGSLSYNSSNGVITYNGPTATETRAHISAEGSLSYTAATGVVSFTERTDGEVKGLISVTDSGGDGSLSYDNSTGVITYTGPTAAETRTKLSVTDTGGDGSLSYNSTDGVFTYTGPSDSETRAHFSSISTGSGFGSCTYTAATGVINYTGITTEEIQDVAGAMVSGTGADQDGISVTYDDASGKLDFAISTVTPTTKGLMSNTDKTEHDAMWTVFEDDADGIINKVEEVLTAFSGSADTLNIAAQLAAPTAMTLDGGDF